MTRKARETGNDPDAPERRGPSRMGIDSESAGALKGSAPYQSPAVMVNAQADAQQKKPSEYRKLLRE